MTTNVDRLKALVSQLRATIKDQRQHIQELQQDLGQAQDENARLRIAHRGLVTEHFEPSQHGRLLKENRRLRLGSKALMIDYLDLLERHDRLQLQLSELELRKPRIDKDSASEGLNPGP